MRIAGVHILLDKCIYDWLMDGWIESIYDRYYFIHEAVELVQARNYDWRVRTGCRFDFALVALGLDAGIRVVWGAFSHDLQYSDNLDQDNHHIFA